MHRLAKSEILDRPGVPEPLADDAYRQLGRIHRLLGDTASIVSALRRDPLPVRKVMDIGCANGAVLRDIRDQLGLEVLGIDIRPVKSPDTSLPIIEADAVRDTLPHVDVAFSMHLGHHLSEADLVGLIRNVGRYCRRFILLDLVRHPLPLALFGTFVAPFVGPITAADGKTSVRRSYTVAEMRKLVGEALSGGCAEFHHSVAPLYIRQVVDILYMRNGAR